MISIFKSKVLEIEKPTSELRILKLSAPESFEFKAGQYLSLSVFRKDGVKIRRPLSIANAPSKENKEIEFCVKLVEGGLASEYIRKLKVGDEVELFGPAGRFTIDSNEKRDLFFIAAGVGVAPFVGMIKDLLNKNFGGKIILLKSSRDEKSALYDSEFEKLARKHRNFEFQNIFSRTFDPNGKDVGHVQDFLEKYLPKDFNGDFYICGLQEMIEETKAKLKSLGVEDKRIFEEKFD